MNKLIADKKYMKEKLMFRIDVNSASNCIAVNFCEIKRLLFCDVLIILEFDISRMTNNSKTKIKNYEINNVNHPDRTAHAHSIKATTAEINTFEGRN